MLGRSIACAAGVCSLQPLHSSRYIGWTKYAKQTTNTVYLNLHLLFSQDVEEQAWQICDSKQITFKYEDTHSVSDL